VTVVQEVQVKINLVKRIIVVIGQNGERLLAQLIVAKDTKLNIGKN